MLDGTDEAKSTEVAALTNLLVDEERAKILKDIALKLPDITLNDRQLCDLELLAVGAFSPLAGFMTRADYEAVIDRMRLQDGTLWPLPICLDVNQLLAGSLEAGQSVALRDPEGFLLAIMHIEDIWPANTAKEAAHIYGTEDPAHPGVRYLFSKVGEFYIGGRLEVVNLPVHFDYQQLRLSPREIRGLYKKLNWKRAVGFQTRHPIHRRHFEMTIRAMRQSKANLLVLPVVGMTQPGDFDHYTRVRCYRKVMKNYPPDTCLLNLLPHAMRLAGPKEAILDMIVAKNFGCTHFIIGHDHAGPDKNADGRPFYPPKAAQKLAETHAEELGLDIVTFDEWVYLPFEDEFRPVNEVPEGTQTISLSGADIRRRMNSGRHIPEWATFPEVLAELEKAYPPPKKQGFTVFLTGLSGAGKSTIARILYSRFLEIGERPVTLLDGDIVRHNLSSELNFSKEHRDTNVRRIGFVASEITKNRGIAICAPIAPYADTRREIRATIESYGGFVEIHIATPIEVCEKRDRKGMYAKARAGLIKGYTGVDAPYEIPESPELSIDTTHINPNEAVQEILLLLGQNGYL